MKASPARARMIAILAANEPMNRMDLAREIGPNGSLRFGYAIIARALRAGVVRLTEPLPGRNGVTIELVSLPAPTSGTGTIDGHDEDEDLRLLVASIDKRAIDRMDPGAPFWDAMARRDPLLRRTAAKFGLEVSEPGDPLPPKTVRICASFLLSD